MTEKINASELDSQLILLKQRLFDLKKEELKYLNENKLSMFIPHPKQRLFFEQSGIKRRAVFSGNRFGKSTVGVVEDCCWLLGYRPFYPETDPRRTQGIPSAGVKILVIAEDWDKVREIFTDEGIHADKKGKFFDFLPKWSIAQTRRNQNGVIDIIYVQSEVNGIIRKSAVYFDTVKSFKQNGGAHESSDWDAIHLDEPVPHEMWIAMSRGLIDRGGYSWWLMTPLKETWMYTYFADENATNPNYWYLVGDTDDNPLLRKEDKELFFANLTDEEIECRKKGLPLAFGSLVYPYYDDNKHVYKGLPPEWDSVLTPPKDYLCAYAIDPHPQTPMTVLFIAISPNNDVFIFHEIFEKMAPTELAKQILKITAGLRIGYELCDPFAWIEDPETGRCWADLMNAQGLHLEKASKAKSTGIIEAGELWRPKEKRKTVVNNIWVMEHCRVFRKEIKNYVFDKENKPQDKDDHLMECFYRLVIHNGLRYIKPYDFKTSISNSYNDNVVNFQTESINFSKVI